MDRLIDVFLNWQVLLISFSVFILLGTIRGVGTKKNKDGNIIGGYAQSKYFKKFTPAYPLLLALGLVFIPGVPLPEVATTTVATKVLFGVYSGWLSSFSYQLVKNVFKRAGAELTSEKK